MTQDTASLGITVDSSETVTGAQNLDRFRTSASAASYSVQELGLQHAQAAASTAVMTQATQALSRNINDVQAGFTGLIERMAEARTQMLATSAQADTDNFTKLRVEVENLGKAFGVTSTGLEAYARQSAQLGFTQSQTAQSLERITEALNNQTVAGQQARRIIQDYGVSLNGLTANNADQVLQKFTERLRTFADSAQKMRSASVVLGRLDADTFGTLNQTDYVTVDQRKQQKLDAQYTREIADRTRNTDLLRKQTANNRAEYDDLSGRYSLSNLGADGRQALAKTLNLDDGGTGSRDDKLAMLRALAKDPASAQAQQGRGVFGRTYDALSAGPMNAYRNLTSGTYTANQDEISARFDQNWDKYGLIAASGARLRQEASNLIGQYTPLSPQVSNLPMTPGEKLLNEQNLGTKLAGYGDMGMSRRARADEALRDFQFDSKTGLPSDDASNEALQAFQKTYRTGDGEGGLREGSARYMQVRGRLTRQQETALTPGTDELDSAAEQRFLLRQAPEDRGQARAYVNFLKRPDVGADTSKLFAQSPGSDPGLWKKFMQPGGFGSLELTPQQQSTFQNIQKDNNDNQKLSATQDFNKQMADQDALTKAAGTYGTAMQDLTAYQTAYNTAVSKGLDMDAAKLAGARADEELAARRATSAAELITNMKEENQLAADRINQVRQAGGGADGIAAGMSADIISDYKKLKNPQLSQDEYVRQRRSALGNQAAASGNALTEGASQDLATAQQLLTVATSRSSEQAKLTRDLEVEKSYETTLAAAKASEDQRQIDAVRQKIEVTKQLKDETARLNAEAQAYRLGTESNRDAAQLEELMAQPRSQRARFAAGQRATRYGQDNGLIPDGTPYAPGSNTDGYNWHNPTNLGAYPGQPGLVGRAGRIDKNTGLPQFGVYQSDEMGAAAGLRQMLIDQNKGYDTIQKELDRRSPSQDNNDTPKMIAFISKQTGVDPNTKYDLNDPDFARKFLAADIAAEHGYQMPDPRMVAAGVDIALRGGQPAAAPNGPAAPDGVPSAPGIGPAGQGGSPGVGYLRQGDLNKYDTEQRKAAQDLQEQADIATRGNTSVLPLIRSGQTGGATLARQANIDPIDPQAGLKSQLEMRQTMAGFQQTFAGSQAQTDEAIDTNTRLAAAYKKGGQAVDELNASLKVEAERRTLLISPTQATERFQQVRSDQTNKANADLQSSIRNQKDALALQDSDNSMGPFASADAIAANRSTNQLEQTLGRSSASDSDKDQARSMNTALELQKRQTEEVQNYRDAWKSAGDATMSALDGLITNGGTAKAALAGLARSLSSILLQAAEKPLMKAGGDWFSSLLGMGGSAVGGAGAAGDVAGISASAAAFAASGAAFSGGVRMMAAGGVLDRPTRFYSAGGQANVAGEAGNEAIMPLRRMANGNLGVAGGGGGSSVTIHAPITIQGNGGSSDGKMDPAVAAGLQKHIEDTVRVATVNVLAQEMRPGGSLYH